MPMPKATVATITTPSSLRKTSWWRGAHALVEAGVIGERAVALAAKCSASALGPVARGGVDDAALALVAGEEILDLPARLVLGGEAKVEVRPVEAVRGWSAALGEELRGDVGARGVVGGGGERDRRDAAERRADARRAARYSGRKSWPHCETQCASSMARRRDAGAAEARDEARRRRAAPARRRGGGAAPRSMRRHAASLSPSSLCELSVAAATPRLRICPTWSRISAISGETTTVRPPSTIAGSW